MTDTSALTPQAATLLQDYLQNPGDADRARIAARAVSGCQQWGLAAAILRQALQGGQVEIGDLLDYGYYLLEAGNFAEAAGLAATVAPVFNGLDGAQKGTLTEIGQRVYPWIAQFYAKGQRQQADMLADMILPYEPFGRRLLGLDPPAEDIPRPSALTDEAVEAFIDQQMAAAQDGDRQGGEALPLTGSGDPDRHRGRRVLILHRKHYHPNLRSGEHPAGQYFLKSAEEAGLDPRLIASDFACSVAASADPELAAQELAEISALIEQWQPEVVVCDGFGGKGRDEITDRILDLRQEQGFRLVGIYHDIWKPEIRQEYADGMAEVDVIWFFDPLSTTAQMEGYPQAIGTVPPIPEKPFAEAQGRVEKTRELGFIGSIWASNHIRGVWLMALERQGQAVDVVTGYPYASNGYQTAEEFADFMASCKVTLCFCGRTSQHGALPARVWEGIWAGSVLLEDDTAHLRQFLTPFMHYIPFRTLEELTFYAGFLQRRGEVRDRMAAAARDCVRVRYPLQQVWGAVLDMALSSPASWRG